MTTTIILAGGEGKRLGRDKASLVLAGQSLLERVLERVHPLSTDLIVVHRKGQAIPALSTNRPVRYLTDIYPGKGSLGGLYTGLLDSADSHSLVVACDMPFLNVGLLSYMLELSPDFDVVIPRLEGQEHPLHGVYSKRCLEPIAKLLSAGHLKIADFFPQVKVRYVEADEIDRFDAQHRSFFNVNTPEDLAQASEILSRKTP